MIEPSAASTSASSGSGTVQVDSLRTATASLGPTVRRQPASLRKSSGRSASYTRAYTSAEDSLSSMRA